MVLRKYLFVICLLVLETMFGQISNPLKIPIKISGTFGELRNTHFHSGIDIKTQGKQGIKVFSIKDGRIKRIRVSKVGFGKTIYIEHNDGTTSVYGHLKKFSKEIELIVKKTQYEKKSYEVEIYPKRNTYMFKSGTLIGYSGNTGSSSGPHLHFEMRDTKTNYPINPLKILKNVSDTLKPEINSLYLYNVNKNGEYSPLKKIKLKKIKSNFYLADTIKSIGMIGIGIKYYDKQDISYSKNGAYSIDFKINNNTIFNYKMDTISLYDKRYLKLLVDYENWYLNKNKIQKLFIHPKSKYTFMKKNNNSGIINVEKNKFYHGEIEVNDYSGNKSQIKLIIKGTDNDSITKSKIINNIKSNFEYTFESKNIKVEFKKNTFFNDTYIPFNYLNDTLDLGKNIHPIDKKFKIFFNVKDLDSLSLEKGFISKINDKRRAEYIETKKLKNIWSISANVIGKYTLSLDTTPPTIKPLNFKENELIINKKMLRLRVKDDLSGIKKINATINDTWVLFEHEPKNNSITYDLSDIKFNSNKHELEVVVFDQLENRKVYKTIIYRNK